VLVFSSFCVQAQNKEIDNNIESAIEKIKSGDKKTGLKEIKNIVSANPNYIPALAGQIEAFYQAGKRKDAIKSADKAIANHPNESHLLFSRGLIYYYEKEYEKAMENFDLALEKDSDIEAKLYLYRGSTLHKLDMVDEAIIDLENAISLKPNHTAAYYKRGAISYQMGDYEEAIEHFNMVIQIEDESSVAYYNRGMAYYKMEKMKEACRDFNRSCQLKNKNACKMVITDCGRNQER